VVAKSKSFTASAIFVHDKSRSVTTGEQERQTPPAKFFPPLEKCVGHNLKLLDIVKKFWATLRKPSYCPNLVTVLDKSLMKITSFIEACFTETQSGGISVSIPSTFNAESDMVTVLRSINDTSLSISKFEVHSTNNAILILVEPEDERYSSSLVRFN